MILSDSHMGTYMHRTTFVCWCLPVCSVLSGVLCQCVVLLAASAIVSVAVLWCQTERLPSCCVVGRVRVGASLLGCHLAALLTCP